MFNNLLVERPYATGTSTVVHRVLSLKPQHLTNPTATLSPFHFTMNIQVCVFDLSAMECVGNTTTTTDEEDWSVSLAAPLHDDEDGDSNKKEVKKTPGHLRWRRRMERRGSNETADSFKLRTSCPRLLRSRRRQPSQQAISPPANITLDQTSVKPSSTTANSTFIPTPRRQSISNCAA